MYIDEATQLTEEQFRVLAACVRGALDGVPKRCYLTCNPGGIGHQWVKRLFVDRRFRPGERAEEYSFIPAGVRDNKALMRAQPDYIKQLEALPPKLREAWLDGSWDVHMGQFFEDFYDRAEHYADRRWTHVIEPFEIPEDWRIYRSFDWGYNRPFSCGWWAVDFDGVAWWTGTIKSGRAGERCCTTATVTRGEQELYVTEQTQAVASGCGYVLRTAKSIDLTDVASIHALVSGVSGIVSFGAMAEGAAYQTLAKSVQLVNGAYSVDVSALSGQHRLCFAAKSTTSSVMTLAFRVQKVWLE